MAEAVTADLVGPDFIGLGEHDRPDVAGSSPEIDLADGAGQRERIHPGWGPIVREQFQHDAEVHAMPVTPPVRELPRSRLGGADAATQAKFT